MKRLLTSLAIFIFSLFATALASLANAQQQPSAADPAVLEKLFTTLDQNKDGAVSKAEAKSSSLVAPQFDLLDADKDGVLSKGEFMNLNTKS